MSRIFFSIALFISLNCFTSLNSYAADSNQFSYYGFSLQNNSYQKLNFTPEITTTDLLPSIYTDKTSGSAIRLFMGYQINRYIGIEAGAVRQAKAKFSIYNEISTVNETDPTIITITKETVHQGSFKTLSGDIRLIGTYPLSQKMFLKGHLGSLFWDNKFEYLTLTDELYSVSKTKDNGISLITGLGLGYGFSKNIALSLDFESSEIANIKTKTIAFSIMLRY